ncbi:MAG: DMT family transporter [Roseobacter sp.]|jgi:S-adenosylmethionine uptake transporter|nr:DMT family transporter [Roseobacter sp.]
MSPNLQGALLMMASMACFTINDTFIKATGGVVPLSQLLFLRGLLATALIAMLAYSQGAFRVNVPARDWGLIGLRAAAEVCAAYFFLTALLNMPLANVTAILQVLPLTVTLGAALFFKEAIGWRRMIAILIGFAGMLLIVRPGTEGFTVYSVFALTAVACVTLRDLSTRRMSSAAPSLMVTFCSSLAVLLVAGGASVATDWVALTPRLAMLLIASSVFIVGGYLFSVLVMRSGDIAYIAPFRYTGLIWALVLGWLVFGEWPSSVTLIGAGIIVATGVFTLYRERISRQA